MSEEDKPKEPKIFIVPGNHDRSILNPFVKALAKVSLQAAGLSVGFWKDEQSAEKEQIDAREVQLNLLQALSQAGIDPHLFDLMLANELDRSLKKQFGIAFLSATIFFTLLSYAVIVFNSIEKWGISDIAITSLIIETPIQFIGLLYIIARNLFPQSAHAFKDDRGTIAKAPQRRKANKPQT
jgi:hypothetical protein